MSSIGEKLRLARLDQGLDLAEVSVRTKIGKRYLEAIEADDRTVLPGGFFYKNWVQQYANALSLNAEAISSEVDSIVASDREPALPGQDHTRLPKGMRPPPLNVAGRPSSAHRFFYSFGLLLAVVLGCSASYAWWHNSQVNAAALETKPKVETKVDAGSNVSRSISQPPRTSPATHAKTEAPQISSVPPESDPQSPNQSLNQATLTPVSNDDVQIEVSATEETWVSINPDGHQGFSGVLQPAEVRTAAAHEKARIKIGNAGGVSVRLNGKLIGPIGTSGQVKIVVIDRDGFHIVEPRPALPPDAAQLSDRALVAPALGQ